MPVACNDRRIIALKYICLKIEMRLLFGVQMPFLEWFRDQVAMNSGACVYVCMQVH